MIRKILVLILVSAILASAQNPIISSLTPNKAPAGTPATAITISGQNIASGSAVSWTTPDGRKVRLTPDLVQAAQIAATVPAALLSSLGTAQVAVTDPSGVLSNQLPFSITPPVSVSPGQLPVGTVGAVYGPGTLAATGGNPPYTWALSAGSLPPGLSLDPAGSLTGIPAAPGTFTFGARSTDAGGALAASSFTVTVNPTSLRITTPATLPAGVAGFDYPNQVLGATGGVKPYAFSVTGSLPPGLAILNGEINGTPQTAGNASFTLTVTDATNATASKQENITIRPSGTVGLIIGSTSADFSLTAGSGGLPGPVVIPVISSSVAQPISYSAVLNPAAPWVSVISGSTTPGTVTVALTTQALTLPASATPYQTSVVLACAPASPCAGSSETIGVSLSVSSSPPQLSAVTSLLAFTASAATPEASTQILELQNIGGGSLGITSISAADSWLQVGPLPGNLAGGATAAVNITGDPAKLQPGLYRSSVDIVSTGGRASVPVTMLFSAGPAMTVAPAGAQFSMPVGGVLGNPNASFTVAVTGTSPIAYTAQVLPGASWLVLQSPGTGSASASVPGSVSFSVDAGSAAALSPGSYYGTVRVNADGVSNSPQDFQVVLSVSPRTSPSFPDPAPAGLLFISNGTAPVSSQTVKVFANSAPALQYQTAANVLTTANGISWLSVSPSTGSISASAPGTSTVAVNATGLPPGIYRGGVNYAYSVFGVRTVNVTLIVTSQSTATSSAAPASLIHHAAATPGCAASQLIPAQLGPVNNFSSPASWPTPLAIRLYDDCGAPVSNGEVEATFSNGDPVLRLTLVDPATALYSGTWTPRNTTQQFTIGAIATAPGYPAATAQFSGQVRPNTAPSIVPNGVTDIFNPLIGGALAPGTVVQIYGSGLAAQPAQPAALPLPVSVAGTSVLIGGIASPLFYVSPGQINTQIPYELSAGRQYQVIVVANGAYTTPTPIQLDTAAPGILNALSSQIYAQRPDGSFVSDAAPARPGENLVLYVLAMGATDNPAVATGSGAPGLAPGDKLADALAPPVLTVGGSPASIAFAGLTPGTVGLYQINFQVPPDARTGSQELVLSQGGTLLANKTLLPVQP